MERFLGRYGTYTYAIFRIVFGLLFLMHGTQKVLNWPPPKQPMQLPGMLVGAGVIEIICGSLILIGFFAAVAAFLACGEMAVAYFMQHQPGGALPIMNGGELAVMFCFAFLYIACRGSGVWR